MTAPDVAWQQCLAAEQQAVFGYALLGAHLASDSERALARACQSSHERLQDETATQLAVVGITAPAPAADYALPPVTGAASARDLAVRLEMTVASAWRSGYAAASATASTGVVAGQLRTAAQAGLNASAIQAAQWRRASGAAPASVPFPGI